METLTALGPGRGRTKYFNGCRILVGFGTLDAGWVQTETFSLVPPLDRTINASLENQNVKILKYFVNP